MNQGKIIQVKVAHRRPGGREIFFPGEKNCERSELNASKASTAAAQNEATCYEIITTIIVCVCLSILAIILCCSLLAL